MQFCWNLCNFVVNDKQQPYVFLFFRCVVSWSARVLEGGKKHEEQEVEGQWRLDTSLV